MNDNFSIEVHDEKVRRMVGHLLKESPRAVERAIDKMARLVRDELKSQIPKVFDRPTPYTKNSLQLTLTQNHNMRASVWFKEPDRMTEHYLVPQVEGGPRPLKGHERGLGSHYVPGRSAKLDRYGNLPYGTVVQILSVLRAAEYMSGYNANITQRSKKRNRKDRDYVIFRNRKGKLPAGVYERVKTSQGFGGKTAKTLPFGAWQKGRGRGKFSSVVRARGLKLILVQTGKPRYRPRFKFYETGRSMVQKHFARLLEVEVDRLAR